MSQSVVVQHLPKCDLCKKSGTSDNLARYDARLPLIGTWAYVCRTDAIVCGISLGLGKGQALVLEGEDPQPLIEAITGLVFT